MAVIFRLEAECDRCGARADFEVSIHRNPSSMQTIPLICPRAARPPGWRYDKLASGEATSALWLFELLCPSCQEEAAGRKELD
jgi:hypothetical protein